MTPRIPTLEDKVTPTWARRIAEDGMDILGWEAESVCGEETLRIIRLADFVAAEWPDASANVYAAAIHQIGAVCIG